MDKVALRCIVFVNFAVPAFGYVQQCRVLSVGQHAVSVCHGSVCSVGPVLLLCVAFVASPIGRILRDWLHKSPRYRTLIEYGCRC